MGDDLLRKVAETLRKRTRECNMVARLGGDEFGILLAETGAEASMAAVSNLKTWLSLLVAKNGWPVSFSFGVATFERPDTPVEEMVNAADELMYEVKRSGKNSIASRVIHSGPDADASSVAGPVEALKADGRESSQ